MTTWLPLAGWVAWGVLWALALRLALAWGFRRYLKADAVGAALLAYPTMAAVFVGSYVLHDAVLGPGAMYGATPRESFSLIAYLLAPFGMPLLIGGPLLPVGDLLRIATSPSRRAARP